MSRAVRLLLGLSLLGLACDPGGHSGLSERLERLEAEVEQGRRAEQRLPELERDIVNLDAQIEQLEAILVTGEAEAVPRLREALERSGFTQVSVASLGLAEVDGVAVVRLQVEANTPQALVVEALEELAQRPLLVVLEDLSVSYLPDRLLARLRFVAQVGVVAPRP